MRSWFIWNGVDSRTLNIKIKTPPPVQRARERVSDVIIPGRSGSLTQLQAAGGVYDAYNVTLNISVPGECVNAGLFGTLSGAGEITFSSQPDYVQDARIVNALTLARISPGLDWYNGNIVFNCQPLKRLRAEGQQVLTTLPQTVYNLGDVPERPVFRLTGSGDLSLTVNGAEFTITGIPASAGGAVIDCAACEVLSGDGLQLLTSLSAGEFPVFNRGANSVQYTGASVTQLKLLRRQRWL